MDMKMEEAQTMDLDDREQVSAAAALTTVKTSTVNQLRLKFTTLSDGNERQTLRDNGWRHYWAQQREQCLRSLRCNAAAP